MAAGSQVISGFMQTIDNAGTQFIENVYGALARDVEPLFRVMLIFYVVIWGYQVIFRTGFDQSLAGGRTGWKSILYLYGRNAMGHLFGVDLQSRHNAARLCGECDLQSCHHEQQRRRRCKECSDDQPMTRFMTLASNFMEAFTPTLTSTLLGPCSGS